MDGSICGKSGLETTCKITQVSVVHPIHRISVVDKNVRSSLQSCSLQDNKTKLHGLLSCPRSTLKQDKVDIVAAHIARSIVNDAMNNEEDDVEDEESDEEYIDDVVLEEIGDNSDEDETTDTAQQSEKDEDDSEGDDDSEDNNNSGYDDNDDSGGSVSDAVNEGNNDDNSEEVQISDILCTTKSGRTCRTWKGRYLYY